MDLAFSGLFNLNAASAFRSTAIMQSKACMVMRSRPLGASRFVVAGQRAFVETIELDFDALRLKARDICSNNP
jgi:hypothetical protein